MAALPTSRINAMGGRMETPREVLFRVLRDQWGVSNKDLALAILREESVTQGKSPQELIQVRSSLSRYVVHVQPGEYTYGWLAPFDTSVPKVMGLIKRSQKNRSSTEIVAFLSGLGCDFMCDALDEYGLDDSLYANVAKRFTDEANGSMADLAELQVTLFTVCGCLGDPVKAAEHTVAAARKLAKSAALKTSLSSEATGDTTGASSMFDLGLYRCEGDMIVSQVYRVSTDPEGTEIGSMSMTAHSINDVGAGVSRQHLRLWRDDAGEWWAKGLNSTNGTILVSGEDRSAKVVELPRKRRGDEVAQPVNVLPGDKLILAGTTEFVLVALPPED